MVKIEMIPEDSTLVDLVNSLEFMARKELPNTFKAFKKSAALIAYTWKTYAMGAPIKGSSMRIKNATGGYARSIKTKFLSPLNFEIFSDSPIAKYLEHGTKEFDMKETHPFGKRGRVVKETVKRKGKIIREKGDPYLIIPFRHGVPGTLSYVPMPEEIYAKILQGIQQDEIQLSQRVGGRKYSPNYRGELVPRAKYQWGTRMGFDSMDRLDGLVAMNVKQKGSTAKRSEYMTFRVVSVNSPAMKWIVEARRAMNITKYVINNTRLTVERMIQSGLKKDIGMA